MILRTNFRTIIIVLLSIALFFSFDGCSRIAGLLDGEEVVSEKTTTTIDTSVVERKYLDIQPFPEIFKPTQQTIEIVNGEVKEVPNDTPVDSTSERQVRKVNKYKLTNELPNGTVNSTLLIDGELLSSEYELITEEKTITKNTETVRTVVKSGLYGVVGSTLGLDGRIKDVQFGVSYKRKDKWAFDIGPQYDVDPKINLPIQDRAGVFIKFSFKF